tara:strand:- start:163 stop:351 length:189 start_codon:yes stop_codon:yes gene_type:complete
MGEYKCECNDEVVSKSNVTIKCVEGKGAVHDIKCLNCDEYMELANPKTGMPGLGNMYRGHSY